MSDILEVDLTRRHTTRRSLSAEVARECLGGTGLAVALLERGVAGRLDPLGPENPLVFAAGPFADTPIPAATKHAVATISPLTGRVTDGLSSSHWSAALRRLDLGAIVVRGVAAAWTVLAVDAEGVRFEDAAPLLGLSAAETARSCAERLPGDDWRTAAIGLAGERGVRYATIENDGRQAGRGGAGAVMGSKRLKAIALRSAGQASVADPARATALALGLRARMLGPATAKYRTLGTGANLRVLERMGMLPARNFTEVSFAGTERITPERARESPGDYREIRAGCVNCPVACEHMYVRRDAGDGARAAPSEYESVWAFGPNCGIDDLDAVLDAVARCDRYGLDTISTGVTLGFAMECALHGLVDADAFGTPLAFGNAAVLAPAIDAIATCAGFGATLALGTRAAADIFGGIAPDIAPHVKGLELPGYEPRALPAYALALAVSTRGACHNRAAAYDVDLRAPGTTLADEARVAAVIDAEDLALVWDSLVMCKFVRGCFDDFYVEAAALYDAASGVRLGPDELRSAARHTWRRKRELNARLGWTPAEDVFPARFAEPLASGPFAGARIDPLALERCRKLYEAARAGNVPSLA